MSSVQKTVSPTIRKPTTFLCLAPVHSASFPKQQPQSPKMSPITSTAMETAVESPVGSPLLLPQTSSHRRSSTSSIGSATEKRRFLKLGPVFWGGAIGENDYAIED
ncbi:uncharacterized protein H6S33_003466 [Morchella sextelata]|uniref:uncharacterized protein n=1 Tax=Morchella sextelata TaxID=1174677 RepID=UPI001D049090|nr:uncharacterized protein H6S33_003466 [Morchella sextelata]KAH0606632.1 hypothetical protein H6S33_003466 [Morchella sextelata]